jgi:hypothetical protein
MVETSVINPIDRDVLRERFQNAKPFPFFCIDNFLEDEFANQVLGAFPTYVRAKQVGKEFKGVNEKGKVQVTDSNLFAEPVQRLNQALASPEFLALLSYVTGMPNLLADDQLVGGGFTRPGRAGTSMFTSTSTTSRSGTCTGGSTF